MKFTYSVVDVSLFVGSVHHSLLFLLDLLLHLSELFLRVRGLALLVLVDRLQLVLQVIQVTELLQIRLRNIIDFM